MQTLKLIIPGSYYDSQIYSGRLYLWSNGGSIITIDWDRLIDNIKTPDHLKLALVCAFQQSEYLYGNRWKLIFQDEEIRTTIQNKFQELAEKPLELSQEQLYKYCIREQDNFLTFPHADSTIYNNMLYIGSQSGILTTRCNPKNRIPVSPKAEKIWDGPALSLAASYLTLAISGGSAGLFEYNLDFESHYSEPHQLLKQHSSSTRWLYASMFSSSYFNEGYLADFINEENKHDEGKRWQRIFRGTIPSSEIFGHPTKNGKSSFAWGVHDKICFATPRSVEVVKYDPYKDADQRFVGLGSVPTELQGDIVSADSALFGFVVECEDGILVINSVLESMWLPGEPVNWRVFPKSKFYTNQLHVIHEDCLCIYSFNQDYFIDQDQKRVGIRHRRDFTYRSS